MVYTNMKAAKFISRPNRFIANVELDGTSCVCHVKNTGRCKELLTEGAEIFIQESDNPARKTKYDLISVYKGDRLINMDSMVPNKVFHEWIQRSGYFEDITFIKPEFTYKDSRFDFYIERGSTNKKIFVEVKGVTLEEEGIVLFPDAPTERGVKHLNGLIECVKEGYEAYIVFIIQMKGVLYFTPNRKTHEVFADTLKSASEQGVKLLALDCNVTSDSIWAEEFVDIKLK